jgi:RNA polymerase sigma-70 factor (ECF subfamily)
MNAPDASEFLGVPAVSLLAAARAGSASALGCLLEAYRSYLVLVAEQHLDAGLRAKIEPNDVVQDTFLKAQQHFTEFAGRNETEFLAWVKTILKNHIKDVLRHYRGTGMRQIRREVPLDDSNRDLDLKDQLILDTPTPGTKAAGNEEQERLRRAFDQLPPDFQRVIHLHHWMKQPFPAVAQLMNRSEDAVRKLWQRALSRLRSALQHASADAESKDSETG